MTQKCMLLASALLLAACGPSQPAPAAPVPPQGREETRNIRNTEAIGVAGGKIADNLDKALEADEKNKKALEDINATTGNQ